MNQLVLDSPAALSIISDTARTGAVSEMDMGGSCKISVRALPFQADRETGEMYELTRKLADALELEHDRRMYVHPTSSSRGC